MSWYTEDKKMRERLISALVSMCKTHGYELGDEDLKRLKRMKFFELHEFSSKLMTQLEQRSHEVWEQTNQKLKEIVERMNENMEQDTYETK